MFPQSVPSFPICVSETHQQIPDAKNGTPTLTGIICPGGQHWAYAMLGGRQVSGNPVVGKKVGVMLWALLIGMVLSSLFLPHGGGGDGRAVNIFWPCLCNTRAKEVDPPQS
jgi:hypothetical protein